MSELLEKYINEHKDEWYAQGKEEGRIEGATDKTNQIAMKMVQMNVFSDDEIAQITGLSIDSVKAMKESLKNDI